MPLTENEVRAWLEHLSYLKHNLAFQQWYRWEVSRPKEPQAFTAAQIRQWFDREAQRRLGQPFVVDEFNGPILDLLCLYFAEDPRFEEHVGPGGRNYSLQKGLLLRGGVGCGKTTLLTIFSHNPRLPYLVEPCRDLVGVYSRQGEPGNPAGGEEALRYYCQRIQLAQSDAAHFNYRTHAGLALDDIGTENWKAKHYGQQLNVIEHILSSRDDQVVAGSLERWATHATTNVPFDDYPKEAPKDQQRPGLESIYGTRWRSRARGLFNIIDFPSTAPDRRG